SHGNRAVGVSEVPGEGFARRQDEGERAGPERRDEGAGSIRNIFCERVECGYSGYENGGRRRSVATLCVEQAGDGGGAERVAGDAVDGVGGDDDELAATECAAREPHSFEQLGFDAAVVDAPHDASILLSVRAGSTLLCRGRVPVAS